MRPFSQHLNGKERIHANSPSHAVGLLFQGNQELDAVSLSLPNRPEVEEVLPSLRLSSLSA